MPFPEIRHCLICEGVHRESGGKLTLLGFYGIAPDVLIRVMDFTKPLAELNFLLLVGSATESSRAQLSALVRHVDGTAVVDFQPGEVTIPKSKSFRFGLGALKPLFTKPGKYQFVLLVDGKPYFTAEFGIQSQRQDQNEPKFGG